MITVYSSGFLITGRRKHIIATGGKTTLGSKLLAQKIEKHKKTSSEKALASIKRLLKKIVQLRRNNSIGTKAKQNKNKTTQSKRAHCGDGVFIVFFPSQAGKNTSLKCEEKRS